jgi:RNA polymerase sigma-70 factor (ECF subfamily)
VHSLVRRMSGGRDTDELTQDSFVRVWQKLSSFRGDAAFSTWLHRLAVNVVIERFRSDTIRRQRLRDGDDIFETLPAPTRSRDLAMDFEAALATLPDGAREIFVLHDVEGYKHSEIATLLEISAGTSKAQLHRARMMLRRHLRPERP